MGEGYRRLKRGKVDFIFFVVLRVVVSHINFRAALKASVHIFKRERVYGKNAVFSARLDCHVAYGESVVHGKVLYAVAVKFHRFVKRAVNAYHSYNVKYKVFAAHVFCGFALKVLFGSKIAAQLALLRAFNIFVGRKVVHNKRNFCAVCNLFGTCFFKFLDCYGARDIVGEHQV